jgi:hypothetical protein
MIEASCAFQSVELHDAEARRRRGFCVSHQRLLRHDTLIEGNCLYECSSPQIIFAH